MTNDELNKRVAELCGFPVVRSRSDAMTFPCVIDFGEGSFTLLEKEVKPDCEPWDPANKWEQVHDYVIPAIRERTCDVNILHSSNLGDSVEITEWDSTWQMPDEDLSHRAAPNGERLTPRLVCEAALEAWEK